MNRLSCSWSRPDLAALAVLVALAVLPSLRADVSRPVEATHGMVVSVSQYGSEVGLQILQKGGNAVDDESEAERCLRSQRRDEAPSQPAVSPAGPRALNRAMLVERAPSAATRHRGRVGTQWRGSSAWAGQR